MTSKRYICSPLLINVRQAKENSVFVRVSPILFEKDGIYVNDKEEKEDILQSINTLCLATATMIRKAENLDPSKVGKIMKEAIDKINELYVEPNCDTNVQ